MTVITPTDRAELARELARATRDRTPVRIRGGGTASRHGLAGADPSRTVLTTGLGRVLAHEPADLTVTVEGGADADALRDALAARGQMWAQPAVRPGATVGGLLATAASGLSRLRYGAIRDGLLEVVLCTGDGRIVTAGGKTVKGVAGYDLPRLAVGSFGTLGVIVEVTLKLWPIPVHDGWFAMRGTVAEIAAAADRLLRTVHRPVAVVWEPGVLWVRLAGADDDVRPPAGMEADAGGPPRPQWEATLQVGVPPARIRDLAAGLDAEGLAFQALPGVGTCAVAVDAAERVGIVRELALALGGHAAITDAPEELRTDPWGPPPAGLGIMRRLRAGFDPAGILNPGAFVGDARPPATGVASPP